MRPINNTLREILSKYKPFNETDDSTRDDRYKMLEGSTYEYLLTEIRSNTLTLWSVYNWALL